jgi:pimeloyl-ACP methyl ester carboxylesterase
MPNEWSALAEAAADAIDVLTIAPAQSLHRAIARRAFAPTGVASAPARTVHDGVATAVYGGARAAVTVTGRAAAAALRAATAGADVRPLSRSRRGRAVISVVNGLYGDRLERRGNDLAIATSVRHRGEDVACDGPALRTAFPGATGRIAVFVHGLFETEAWWRRGASRHAGPHARPFGERLRRDLGLTAVDVRYNTGLRISENGRRLAALIDSLVVAWPVPVSEIALIGHSMGGLVARSACHQADEDGDAWPQRVRHIVTLGAPHAGAPLEKAVHVAAWALRSIPEAAPFGEILELRSGGIRDLRFGYLRDEDWLDEDPAELLADRGTPVPLLPGCNHTFITATVTRDPDHPVGRMLGDLLVRVDSASGRHRTRTIPVAPESVVHVGGLTHFDLLDHPLVYEQIHRALAGAPGARKRS